MGENTILEENENRPCCDSIRSGHAFKFSIGKGKKKKVDYGDDGVCSSNIIENNSSQPVKV